MTVTNNEAQSRYELEVEGYTAFAAYRRDGDIWEFYHTVVPPELGGRGIGSKLVGGALADVKAQGGKVIATCSFVEAYLKKHPDAADIA